MRFQIEIRTGNSDYVLNVERINETKLSEDFRISNKDGTQMILIRSNRPYLRGRIGTKRWKPKYDIIERTRPVIYRNYVDDAFLEILREIEPALYPRPVKPVYNVPDFKPSPRRSKEDTADPRPWAEKRGRSKPE